MKRTDRSISRITTLIAGIIAVLTVVVIPGGYFAVSYQYMLGSLDAQAEASAQTVTGLVLANPEMWRFEELRLSELLGRRSSSGRAETKRIMDVRGNVVAEKTAPLKPPLVSRYHSIYDAGSCVARIQITRSIAPLLGETFVVALVAFVIAALVFGILRTIPLRAVRRAYLALAESEKKYHSLYDSMKEGMALHSIVFNSDGTPTSSVVIDLNPSCESILGLKREEALGKESSEIFGPLMTEYLPDIVRASDAGESLTFEMPLPPHDGVFAVSVFSPERGLFATLLEDITERKRSEQQIQELAYFDILTGLPNRLLLMDRLEHAVARASRNGKVAVLFLDLDNFKVVNDTMGHAQGDHLLQQVSQRLRRHVRSSDTLARLGGDEFVAVVSSLGEELNVAHIARQLLDSVSPPYMLDGRVIYMGASIGIAVFPEDGEDTQTLLRNADMAMYAAKDEGRNCFRFYSQEMNRRAHERMEMETSMRQALEREEFFLEFQPIVVAGDGRVAGVEALVRWQHPELGRTMPGAFIEIAEDSGLIVPLGEWVLRSVCRKMKAWRDAGLPPVRVSVNVSGRQFAQGNFVDLVSSVLSETGVDPRSLELELTETTLMRNAATTVETLCRLKNLDIAIAVDDFGSGYSSLGYLKNFPIDRIKIDRSFVKDVCSNPSDRAIVEAIIAMAGRLILRVVAEGVETAEQAAFLHRQGCDEIQGYYYHRPLPEESLVALLKSHQRREDFASAISQPS